MRIEILAVGKARAGPSAELARDYLTRFDQMGRGVALGPATVREIPEAKHRNAAERKRAEADALLGRLPEKAILFALDEGGKALSSQAFADLLADARDRGHAAAVFLIGGADGLDPGLRKRADRVLALGPQTWPHMLVRVLLAEQLYRGAAILSGHPYHRQ